MKKPFNFAHLIGGKKPKAEEAAPKKEEEKDSEAVTDDDDDTDDAEDDDDDLDPEAEGEDEEDVESDDKKKPEGNRTARRAMSSTKRKLRMARKAGATAERARCATIFKSKHAAGRADLAASLAFNTDMTAEAAVLVLQATPKASNLADRMKLADPRIGTGAPMAANERVASAQATLRARHGRAA